MSVSVRYSRWVVKGMERGLAFVVTPQPAKLSSIISDHCLVDVVG